MAKLDTFLPDTQFKGSTKAGPDVKTMLTDAGITDVIADIGKKVDLDYDGDLIATTGPGGVWQISPDVFPISSIGVEGSLVTSFVKTFAVPTSYVIIGPNSDTPLMINLFPANPIQDRDYLVATQKRGGFETAVTLSQGDHTVDRMVGLDKLMDSEGLELNSLTDQASERVLPDIRRYGHVVMVSGDNSPFIWARPVHYGGCAEFFPRGTLSRVEVGGQGDAQLHLTGKPDKLSHIIARMGGNTYGIYASASDARQKPGEQSGEISLTHPHVYHTMIPAQAFLKHKGIHLAENLCFYATCHPNSIRGICVSGSTHDLDIRIDGIESEEAEFDDYSAHILETTGVHAVTRIYLHNTPPGTQLTTQQQSEYDSTIDWIMQHLIDRKINFALFNEQMLQSQLEKTESGTIPKDVETFRKAVYVVHNHFVS